MRAIIEEINTLIQDGKTLLAVERVQRALDIGIPAEEIMNDGLMKGLSIIGKKFRDNEVYVPEVLVSARAVSKSLEILRPYFENRGKN